MLAETQLPNSLGTCTLNFSIPGVAPIYLKSRSLIGYICGALQIRSDMLLTSAYFCHQKAVTEFSKGSWTKPHVCHITYLH